MDPLTAGLNLANTLLELAGKVFDATPADLKAQSAGDWAKFAHNISEFLLGIQAKINASVPK